MDYPSKITRPKEVLKHFVFWSKSISPRVSFYDSISIMAALCFVDVIVQVFPVGWKNLRLLSPLNSDVFGCVFTRRWQCAPWVSSQRRKRFRRWFRMWMSLGDESSEASTFSTNLTRIPKMMPSGQIITTNQTREFPQMVVNSKGIHPKCL